MAPHFASTVGTFQLSSKFKFALARIKNGRIKDATQVVNSKITYICKVEKSLIT